jgi:3'-phosphoadenosine 5'-phosphosulfate sulfotransferase (PAPS reductase)/FAD synthetase
MVLETLTRDLISRRLLELHKLYPPDEWLWLISYSGGKDSTTLLLLTLKLAYEKNFRVGVVYNNSGGDIPEIVNLVHKILTYIKKLGHETYITRPEKSFFDYLLTKYSPPRWNFRWCCKRLKEIPFKRFIKELSESRKVLNLVGNRSEEARWRRWFIKKLNENLIYSAPLYDLRNEDVWKLLDNVSMELNMRWIYQELRYIYREGLIRRTGCWFCPLITFDRMIITRPLLIKLKLEILESWCNGVRERILELSKKYPELINVSVNRISKKYPCGRRCNICQVKLIRSTLKDIINNCVNCA